MFSWKYSEIFKNIYFEKHAQKTFCGILASSGVIFQRAILQNTSEKLFQFVIKIKRRHSKMLFQIWQYWKNQKFQNVSLWRFGKSFEKCKVNFILLFFESRFNMPIHIKVKFWITILFMVLAYILVWFGG